MVNINVEPVAALTIYRGGSSPSEEYARRYPVATVSYMMDWKRKELERFTYLTPEAAHSFMEMQAAWLMKPGEPELYVSDMLRPIAQQIELKKRKPRLAALPGLSVHGMAKAVDYDPERLGINSEGERYTWREFGEFIREYEWEIHPRAYRSPSAAECWHINYLGTENGRLHSSAGLEHEFLLRNAEGVEVEIVIESISKLLGNKNLAYKEQVKAIQRMGRLRDDGIVGPKTTGYLTFLSIEHTSGPSTFANKHGIPENMLPEHAKSINKPSPETGGLTAGERVINDAGNID